MSEIDNESKHVSYMCINSSLSILTHFFLNQESGNSAGDKLTPFLNGNI